MGGTTASTNSSACRYFERCGFTSDAYCQIASPCSSYRQSLRPLCLRRALFATDAFRPPRFSPPRFPPPRFAPPKISAPALFAPEKGQGKHQTQNKTKRNHRNQHRREQTKLKANETTATAGPPKPIPKTTRKNEDERNHRENAAAETNGRAATFPAAGYIAAAGPDTKRWNHH